VFSWLLPGVDPGTCCSVSVRVSLISVTGRTTALLVWIGKTSVSTAVFVTCCGSPVGTVVLPSFSPRYNRCVAARFFSVNMKVSSQGNLCGRSLKGALATTG
jgi:hypothetical protein